MRVNFKYLITVILIIMISSILKFFHRFLSGEIYRLVVLSNLSILVILLIWLWIGIDPIHLAIITFVGTIMFFMALVLLQGAECTVAQGKGKQWGLLGMIYTFGVILHIAMNHQYHAFLAQVTFFKNKSKQVQANYCIEMANKYNCKRYYVPMTILFLALYLSTIYNNGIMSGFTIITEIFWFLELTFAALMGNQPITIGAKDIDQ
jgi:hypothetical protein